MTIPIVNSWRWRLSASHEHKGRWRKQFTSLWGRLSIRMSHYMWPAHPISTNALALPITTWNPRKTQRTVTTAQMRHKSPSSFVLCLLCYILYISNAELRRLAGDMKSCNLLFFFSLEAGFPKGGKCGTILTNL